MTFLSPPKQARSPNQNHAELSTESSAGSVKRRKKSEPPRKIEPHREFLFGMQQFFHDLDSLSEAFRAVMPLLRERDESRKREFNELIMQMTELVEGLKRKKKPNRPNVHLDELVASIKRLFSVVSKLNRATIIYQRNAVISLIARLDEFTAETLTMTFRAKPELLAGGDRLLPYDRVLSARSLEDVIGAFVEAEVDKILRGSHVSQIDYLDKRFKLGIREYFKSYGEFVELVERRHLFVHAGGKVNSQYLSACVEAGYNVGQDVLTGTILFADDEYCDKAFDLVFEFALRVGQALVRRVFPDHLDEADSALSDHGLRLLQEEQWHRAETLFTFAGSIPEKLTADESSRRIFLVNRAISLQAQQRDAEARKLLDSLDWSTTHPRFNIVIAALKREFKPAAQLMVRFRTEISESDYREWPAFREFRQTLEFRKAFQKVFRKEYIPVLPQAMELANSLLQRTG